MYDNMIYFACPLGNKHILFRSIFLGQVLQQVFWPFQGGSVVEFSLTKHRSKFSAILFKPRSLQIALTETIDPPHPLVRCKRQLNEAIIQMRLKKLRPLGQFHSRCDTVKIPPCSKALSNEHRPKFCSPSLAMVTSPYKWKIVERNVKQ
jgi:hypothetical protein